VSTTALYVGLRATDPAGNISYPAAALVPSTLPTLGRCVKAARGKGELKSVHCNLLVAGGKYNWLPGPGAKRKFTSILKNPTLETRIHRPKILDGEEAHPHGLR
jgi:hypothetical protein